MYILSQNIHTSFSFANRWTTYITFVSLYYSTILLTTLDIPFFMCLLRRNSIIVDHLTFICISLRLSLRLRLSVKISYIFPQRYVNRIIFVLF